MQLRRGRVLFIVVKTGMRSQRCLSLLLLRLLVECLLVVLVVVLYRGRSAPAIRLAPAAGTCCKARANESVEGESSAGQGARLITYRAISRSSGRSSRVRLIVV